MTGTTPIDVIIQGDALTKLKELPGESVDCCITSPSLFWFEKKDRRLDITNLILLCAGCHKFVHSKMNISGEFIDE